MASALQQGRIVWVTTSDPNGVNEKKRPAVVLTPTAAIRPDEPVALAAISSSNVAPEDELVRLTWNREGTTSTRLRKASHVVCSWSFTAPASALEVTAGVTNSRELIEIIAKVNAANTPPPDV